MRKLPWNHLSCLKSALDFVYAWEDAKSWLQYDDLIVLSYKMYIKLCKSTFEIQWLNKTFLGYYITMHEEAIIANIISMTTKLL